MDQPVRDAMFTLPVGLVPMPTQAYRQHRKLLKTLVEPGRPVIPAPVPQPAPVSSLIQGSRVLMWKQDPSVAEIGIRKAFLPGPTLAGPRNSRTQVQGLAPVAPNAFGDFVQTPGTDAFDAVHTFTVVRQTLTMYERALATGTTPAPLPWQWNTGGNTDLLQIFPHGLPDTMNAFYRRSAKELRFGDFVPSGTTERVFTCRSFDIVAHETGHAILDGLKPNWLLFSAPPQTGGLHEAFGDITAIFLALSQLDQVEAVIAQTKADLHAKTFLADLAEQFGLALGRPTGLRNADNDLKLSEVGTEVHAISQVFTGAIYDILADIFAFERRPGLRDDAAVLHDVAAYVCGLLLRAIMAAPASNATFADVANRMLQIAASDGKPADYRNFIRNRFTVREVVVSPTPLTKDVAAKTELAPGVQDEPGAIQNRSGCCGTMTSPEFTGAVEAIDAELKELKKHFRGEHGKG